MTGWQIRDNKFDLSLTHSIAASTETIYGVLANLEAYPEFVNDLISVKRDRNLYRFVARAAILTIPVTVAVTKTPGKSVSFELVEGPVDQLTGNWLIETGESPGQTKVTLTIHAETDERGEWLLRMTGRYVQNKSDKLIDTFSRRITELQHGAVAPSAPRSTAHAGILKRFKRWWARVFGEHPVLTSEQPLPAAKPAPTLFRDEHHVQTLEAMASTMIPPDDFDSGVQNLGFVSLAEMRSRYEAGREKLYATALDAVDEMAQAVFDKPHFVDLAPEERIMLLDQVRQGQVDEETWGQVKAPTFFGALWEDVVFLYCTHPDTWQRVGFAGPSFDTGGHPDFAQPQEFIGEM